MNKLFNFLFDYLKSLGWKKYLTILVVEILVIGVIFGLFLLASKLFEFGLLPGYIGIVVVLICLILAQYFIFKKR